MASSSDSLAVLLSGCGLMPGPRPRQQGSHGCPLSWPWRAGSSGLARPADGKRKWYRPASGHKTHTPHHKALPCLPVVSWGTQWSKNPAANVRDARDAGSILGSGRSPGEENGNPFQCSCLGNPMDRGAWRAIRSMGPQRARHD